MSNLFNKFIATLLSMLVIVLFIVGFREVILTDSATNAAFGALMGILPFVEPIAEIACKILKYPYALPVVSSTSIFSDFIRLSVMSILQPLVVGSLTSIFLALPSKSDWQASEKTMNTLSYRIKEMMIYVISVPALAAISAVLCEWVANYVSVQFGMLGSIVLGSITSVALIAISSVPLIIAGLSIGTALAWRLLITIGYKMVSTLITECACLLVYIALLGGIPQQIASSVLALIICLVVMHFGLQCMQYAVIAK